MARLDEFTISTAILFAICTVLIAGAGWVLTMMMTAVVVAALNYVKRTKRHPVDIWVGVALGALYMFNAWLLFDADAGGR